ncbi:MAG: RNase P subunit [Nitrososphaerota archaeon]|nr:RNase P subunit [Nitrososphaerota archaeon]
MPQRRGRQQALDSRKQQRRKIASEQIDRLIECAILERRTRSGLALRYADMAWKLSTRFNVRLGARRLLFCRKCKEFITPADTARVRLSKKRKSLNFTCLRCQSTYRKIIRSNDIVESSHPTPVAGEE